MVGQLARSRLVRSAKPAGHDPRVGRSRPVCSARARALGHFSRPRPVRSARSIGHDPCVGRPRPVGSANSLGHDPALGHDPCARPMIGQVERPMDRSRTHAERPIERPTHTDRPIDARLMSNGRWTDRCTTHARRPIDADRPIGARLMPNGRPTDRCELTDRCTTHANGRLMHDPCPTTDRPIDARLMRDDRSTDRSMHDPCQRPIDRQIDRSMHGSCPIDRCTAKCGTADRSMHGSCGTGNLDRTDENRPNARSASIGFEIL